MEHPTARVLAVDDNEMNLAIMEEALGEHYHLLTASSGEKALEVAREAHPDVILLDIMMPGIDGYETCRRLRSDERLQNVKIVLVSAKAMVSERIAGYEAGADDYVTKPFDPDELLAKVRVYVRLKHVEELDRLRSDVLSLLSHEIRTSLTGIGGSLTLLGDWDALGEEARKDMLMGARQSYERLLSMVEKSLLLCKLRSGRVALDRQRHSIDSVVAEAISSLEEMAEEADVTLRPIVEAGSSLYGDRAQLVGVLVALIENAIEASPAGDEVLIEGASTARESTICVVDHGPGVEPEARLTLFREFTASDVRHHSQGHGLSLSLSLEIMQLHGGSVELLPDGGQTTRFRMSLPFVEPGDDVIPAIQLADQSTT